MKKKLKDRILIVDDEPQINKMLVANFSDKYDTDTAESVKEAEKKITAGKYALVITDMSMEGQNGLDVIRLVKAKSPQTMVLMITGYSSVEDAVNALRLGAEDYVQKPLDLARFNVTVKNVIEKFHQSRQLNKIQRLFELEKASRAVLESENIGRSMPEILKMILGMFKADSGSVMLFDKSSGQLVVSAAEGISPDIKASIRVSSGDKISGWAVKHNRALLLDSNSGKSRKMFKNYEPRSEIKSSLVVPLAIRGKLLGVLNLNILSGLKRFTEEDLDIITIFSFSLALSIENARYKNELVENNEQLKEIDKLKTELISNVSHELMTPLTAVKGSLDLLLYYTAETPEASKKLLAIIKNNLERQIKLVAELLEFSKLEANKIKIEKTSVDAAGLLREAAEELSSLVKKSGLELKFGFPDKPQLLNADPNRVKQVLINLIANAIKFTAKGYIELSLEGKTESVIFSVKDTGCGIPGEAKEKIFERFYRVDNPVTRNTPGFGLGLPLSKAIIEAHGGKIWVESEEGKGSVFYFMLPR